MKDGIWAVGFGGGQVDITSGKFVFSCTEAYRVRDGRIGAARDEPRREIAEPGLRSGNDAPVDGDAGTYDPVRVTVTDDAPFPLEDFDEFRLTITGNTAPVNQAANSKKLRDRSFAVCGKLNDAGTITSVQIPGIARLSESLTSN